MIHKKDLDVESDLKNAQKAFDEQSEGYKDIKNAIHVSKEALMRLNERHKNMQKVVELTARTQQLKEAQESTYKLCMDQCVCPFCGAELIEEGETLKCVDCKKIYEKPEEPKDANK